MRPWYLAKPMVPGNQLKSIAFLKLVKNKGTGPYFFVSERNEVENRV